MSYVRFNIGPKTSVQKRDQSPDGYRIVEHWRRK